MFSTKAIKTPYRNTCQMRISFLHPLYIHVKYLTQHVWRLHSHTNADKQVAFIYKRERSVEIAG